MEVYVSNRTSIEGLCPGQPRAGVCSFAEEWAPELPWQERDRTCSYCGRPDAPTARRRRLAAIVAEQYPSTEELYRERYGVAS